MLCIEVGGMTLPIIGQVERKNGDMVPSVGIKMMSDERWPQGVRASHKPGGKSFWRLPEIEHGFHVPLLLNEVGGI